MLGATAVRTLVAKLAPDDRWASRAAALGIGCFGLWAGHDALGPDLGGDAHRTLGWALGAVLALLGAGLTLRPANQPGTIATAVLGLALGLVPVASWLAAERTLAFDDIDEASEPQARWRRRLAPNDARAWLALAQHARSRDQNDHALAMASVARRLAPDDERMHARILELRSDVLATRGECDEARALFEEALEARAHAAMESLDLDLSEAYRLPPALASECGLED